MKRTWRQAYGTLTSSEFTTAASMRANCGSQWTSSTAPTQRDYCVSDIRPGCLVGKALVIVDAVADALDYAYQRGLLHRDVKPANILLTTPEAGRRRILLADFGIARQAGEISGLTVTNMTIGTVSYAAPEQLMGETVDGRADQYALAATAFHLLTGAPLFTDSNPAVLISKHLNAHPPSLAQRRPELAPFDHVLSVALAKDSNARYGSCLVMAAHLRDPSIATGDPTALATPTRDATLAAAGADSRCPRAGLQLDCQVPGSSL